MEVLGVDKIILSQSPYFLTTQELQKTTQEVFRIEKILKRKGSKSLVKWLGYPDSFNSWVDNSDLIKL